jgi:hypothetical protein
MFSEFSEYDLFGALQAIRVCMMFQGTGMKTASLRKTNRILLGFTPTIPINTIL